jgi:hypothetical protein
VASRSHGGLLFFTYPILAALLMPLPLVVTARLSRLRVAPVLVLLVTLLLGLAGSVVARTGFALGPAGLVHRRGDREGPARGADVALARLPAFAQSLPSASQIVVAAILTMVAALAGGALARRATVGA